MFTDKQTSSKRLSTACTLQQLHELTTKLEFAHQEIRIIRLEKLEYEKEINHLKQENETLVNESKCYLETARSERQEKIHLHSMSMNANASFLYNNDLNIEISEHKKLIKTLKLNNINLQKENEKYNIILEELNEEKQKRDEININNTVKLENEIKDLQKECDGLREEINAINTLNALQTCYDSYSRSISTKYAASTPSVHGFRLSLSMRGSEINANTLFSEFENDSYSPNIEVDIICNDNDNDNDGIINQLIQFGNSQNDINTAINIANNKNNINEIVEIIENGIDSEYDASDNKMVAKMATKMEANIIEKIEGKIEKIINTSKDHINKLRKRIEILSKQNHELIAVINKKQKR